MSVVNPNQFDAVVRAKESAMGSARAVEDVLGPQLKSKATTSAVPKGGIVGAADE